MDHTDFGSHAASPPHKSTLAFGNACWCRAYGDFTLPPSSALRLLLVSVHIHRWSLVDDREGALEYLKAQQPIGARDTQTLGNLRQREVSSFFSACLTLTWDPNIRLLSPQPRSQVLEIDAVGSSSLVSLVPPEILQSYTSYSVDIGYVDSQGIHTRPPFHHPFQYAYANLLQIAGAKLVITSRIHVALPCVALGTPVIFTLVDGAIESDLPGGGGGRVDGLTQLFHVAYLNTTDNSWRFEANFDWKRPPPNPSPHLRQKFVANLWSRIRREPIFADGARTLGLFPRQPDQSLEKEIIQVIEGEGIPVTRVSEGMCGWLI